MVSEQYQQIRALWQHTPTLAVFDARGLMVRQVQYNRSSAHEAVDERITQHQYDAAGRLRSSLDPRQAEQRLEKLKPPPNWATWYSLSGRVLRTESVDAGWRAQCFDAAGRPWHSFDGRNTQQRFEYDALSRPTAIYETVNHQSEACVERFAYGDSGAAQGAEQRNVRGRLMRHEDPAGARTVTGYSLTGAALGETRRVLKQTEAPNWPIEEAQRAALLEAEEYTTHWTHNALGELLSQTDAKGHQQRFEYNAAGQLHAVSLKRRDQKEAQLVVTGLTYTALGQLLREEAGNGVVTTYTYDPKTLRLEKSKAMRANGEVLQWLVYQYDPVGNILSIEDKAICEAFFRNEKIEAKSTYDYDALYQLVRATGREQANAIQGSQSLSLRGPPPAECAR